jgi:hypothetical protein
VNRSNRLPFAIISGLAFLLVAVWLLRLPVAGYPDAPLGQLILVGGACMALYLASHVLRAIRIAVIGVSIYKTSFRTLALLNLSIAPWSMIAPFKLDELIRVNELRSVNGSLARALMTLVIDRSMDGPMFLGFALILSAHGAMDTAMFAGLLGLAMIAVTIGFFAASQILQFAQRYIFLYHYKPRALYALRIIHQLRQIAALGRETIMNTAPILFVCTLGIWFLEISAVGLMLWIFMPDVVDLSTAVSATLVRANSGWRAILLGESLGFPAALITTYFTAGLLMIWPLAIWLYCKRRLSEVRDAEFLDRQWGVRTNERLV